MVNNNSNNIYFEWYSVVDLLELKYFNEDFTNLRINKNYRWDRHTVLSFLIDLKEYIETNFQEIFYLGNITIASTPDNNKKQCTVVEGQQRILTGIIIMRVLYMQIKEVYQQLLELHNISYSLDAKDSEHLDYTNTSELDYSLETLKAIGITDHSQHKSFRRLINCIKDVVRTTRFVSYEQGEVFSKLDLILAKMEDIVELQNFKTNLQVGCYLTSREFITQDINKKVAVYEHQLLSQALAEISTSQKDQDVFNSADVDSLNSEEFQSKASLQAAKGGLPYKPATTNTSYSVAKKNTGSALEAAITANSSAAGTVSTSAAGSLGVGKQPLDLAEAYDAAKKAVAMSRPLVELKKVKDAPSSDSANSQLNENTFSGCAYAYLADADDFEGEAQLPDFANIENSEFSDSVDLEHGVTIADLDADVLNEIRGKVLRYRFKCLIDFFKSLENTRFNTTFLYSHKNHVWLTNLNMRGRSESPIETLLGTMVNSVTPNALRHLLEIVYRIEDLIIVNSSDANIDASLLSVNEQIGAFFKRSLDVFLITNGCHEDLKHLTFNERVRATFLLLRQEIIKHLDYYIDHLGLDLSKGNFDRQAIKQDNERAIYAFIRQEHKVHASKLYPEWKTDGFTIPNKSTVNIYFNTAFDTNDKGLPFNLELKNFDIRKDFNCDPEVFKQLLLLELTDDYSQLSPHNYELEMYIMLSMALIYAQAFNLISFVDKHIEQQTDFDQNFRTTLQELKRFKDLNQKASTSYLLYLTHALVTQQINDLEYIQCLNLLRHYIIRNQVAKRPDSNIEILFKYLLEWSIIRPVALEFFITEVIVNSSNLVDDFRFFNEYLVKPIDKGKFLCLFANSVGYTKQVKNLQTKIISSLTNVLMQSKPVEALESQPELLKELQDLTFSFARFVCRELVLYEFIDTHNLNINQFDAAYFVGIAQKILDQYQDLEDDTYRLDFLAQSKLSGMFDLKIEDLKTAVEIKKEKDQYMHDLLQSYFPNSTSASEQFKLQYKQKEQERQRFKDNEDYLYLSKNLFIDNLADLGSFEAESSNFDRFVDGYDDDSLESNNQELNPDSQNNSQDIEEGQDQDKPKEISDQFAALLKRDDIVKALSNESLYNLANDQEFNNQSSHSQLAEIITLAAEAGIDIDHENVGLFLDYFYKQRLGKISEVTGKVESSVITDDVDTEQNSKATGSSSNSSNSSIGDMIENAANELTLKTILKQARSLIDERYHNVSSEDDLQKTLNDNNKFEGKFSLQDILNAEDSLFEDIEQQVQEEKYLLEKQAELAYEKAKDINEQSKSLVVSTDEIEQATAQQALAVQERINEQLKIVANDQDDLETSKGGKINSALPLKNTKISKVIKEKEKEKGLQEVAFYSAYKVEKIENIYRSKTHKSKGSIDTSAIVDEDDNQVNSQYQTKYQARKAQQLAQSISSQEQDDAQLESEHIALVQQALMDKQQNQQQNQQQYQDSYQQQDNQHQQPASTTSSTKTCSHSVIKPLMVKIGAPVNNQQESMLELPIEGSYDYKKHELKQQQGNYDEKAQIQNQELTQQELVSTISVNEVVKEQQEDGLVLSQVNNTNQEQKVESKAIEQDPVQDTVQELEQIVEQESRDSTEHTEVFSKQVQDSKATRFEFAVQQVQKVAEDSQLDSRSDSQSDSQSNLQPQPVESVAEERVIEISYPKRKHKRSKKITSRFSVDDFTALDVNTPNLAGTNEEPANTAITQTQDQQISTSGTYQFVGNQGKEERESSATYQQATYQFVGDSQAQVQHDIKSNNQELANNFVFVAHDNEKANIAYEYDNVDSNLEIISYDDYYANQQNKSFFDDLVAQNLLVNQLGYHKQIQAKDIVKITDEDLSLNIADLDIYSNSNRVMNLASLNESDLSLDISLGRSLLSNILEQSPVEAISAQDINVTPTTQKQLAQEQSQVVLEPAYAQAQEQAHASIGQELEKMTAQLDQEQATLTNAEKAELAQRSAIASVNVQSSDAYAQQEQNSAANILNITKKVNKVDQSNAKVIALQTPIVTGQDLPSNVWFPDRTMFYTWNQQPAYNHLLNQITPISVACLEAIIKFVKENFTNVVIRVDERILMITSNSKVVMLINLSRVTIATIFSIEQYPQLAPYAVYMECLEQVNATFNQMIVAKNVKSIYNIFNVLFALAKYQDTELVANLLNQIKDLATKGVKNQNAQ